MGTNQSSETPRLADYLRSQRTTTQQEVDRVSAGHGVQTRWEIHKSTRAACASAH